MDIYEAMFDRATTFAGLFALIGLNWFPETAPQSAVVPFVIVNEISNVREHTMVSTNSDQRTTFQMSVFAPTNVIARAVIKQLDLAFSDFTGIMGGAGGVTVERILFEGSRSNTRPDMPWIDGSGVQSKTIFNPSVDYFIAYKE